MTEAELEENVRQACQALGLFRWHVHGTGSRRMAPGFPDDVIVGRRGVLWRELKSSRGKLTPEQRAAGRALCLAGQDWSIWRPADWPRRIMEELEAIR